MRKYLSYIRIGLTAGLALLYWNLKYFRKFSKHPEKYSFEYRYEKTRKVVLYVLRRFHVDYKVMGFDNYQKLGKKCLIVSNHHSDADPLIMVALHEKPITFISKKEAFDFPIVGNALRGLEAFSLDRENVMNQINQIKQIVAHLKDETKPDLVVYIEGTRNRTPEDGCLPFHAGTLKITKMAGVPVLPLSLYGTSRILTKNSYLKKYPVFINYMKPIEYYNYENFDTNDEAAKLRHQIDDDLDKSRQLDLDYIYNQKISRKRKALETIIDIKRLP